ncbi:ATP-grasp domain-containing protein [Streptomyces alfalfae]|uniref:ATP-grasp domain-containing protein n=1 Tax=Streptomyces alfalfae TaxID=1642299 RepID=A0A7T4PML1_9ACTN|nr:ATP-grasp domain-containing protein [Streptomyces alfalfae]QQC92995.1 ATP-grasp domain-containing protein [Streptomyces alfalfae]
MPAYLLVGYSADLLRVLDGFLAPDSVLVMDEPEVLAVRGARDRTGEIACFADVLPAPVQTDADRLPALVAPPPGVSAVLPGNDYGVVAAAVLADAWGLPGPGAEAARTFRDKRRQRRLADEAGIPQPAWREVSDAAEAAEFAAGCPDGFVLKPATLQSSEGVLVLEPGADVAAAWRHTTARNVIGGTMRLDGAPSPCLAERRLLGEEFSVELLLRDGAALFCNVTAKRLLGGVHPVEMGHVVPAPPEGGVRESLSASMLALARASGFRTGVMHGEWIIEDGMPHLVECAARLPGDQIHRLIELAYDWDLLRNWFRIAAGQEPAAAPRRPQGAAIRFLGVPPGRVTSVSGIDEARSTAGVRDVAVSVAVGSHVEPIRSSWERSGFVIATGPDGRGAERTARTASERIVIATEQDALAGA